MLKLSDTGRWGDELKVLYDRASTLSSQLGRKSGVPWEYKFSAIHRTNTNSYEALIDYFISQPDGYFCALIINKTQPGVQPNAFFSSSWDAIISYSAILIKNNIRSGETAIVVSDYYQKPKSSPKYFERQILHRLGGRVSNAIMLDSRSSLFLQLVDVLLGCVMYHFKMPALAKLGISSNSAKQALADRLAAAYGVTNLGESMTRNKPNYLSIWEFKPKSPAT
jgi:hypothetical protein